MGGQKVINGLFLRRLFAAFFALGMIDFAHASSEVFVKIEGPVRLDGEIRFTVTENGSNEVGKFQRIFTFTATADKGAIKASSIRDYKATATFPDGGLLTTPNAPVAGFMYISLNKDTGPFVNIELLEYTDGLPAVMSINGLHRAQFEAK
jgi:hypothetical protein